MKIPSSVASWLLAALAIALVAHAGARQGDRDVRG